MQLILKKYILNFINSIRNCILITLIALIFFSYILLIYLLKFLLILNLYIFFNNELLNSFCYLIAI